MKVDEGDVLTFRSYSLSNTLYLSLSLYAIFLYLTILALSEKICTQRCIPSLRVSAKGRLPVLHTFLSDFCEGWRETCPSKVRYLPTLNLFCPISPNLHPTLHTFLSDFCEGSPSNTAYFPFGFLRRLARDLSL